MNAQVCAQGQTEPKSPGSVYEQLAESIKRDEESLPPIINALLGIENSLNELSRQLSFLIERVSPLCKPVDVDPSLKGQITDASRGPLIIVLSQLANHASLEISRIRDLDASLITALPSEEKEEDTPPKAEKVSSDYDFILAYFLDLVSQALPNALGHLEVYIAPFVSPYELAGESDLYEQELSKVRDQIVNPPGSPTLDKLNAIGAWTETAVRRVDALHQALEI